MAREPRKFYDGGMSLDPEDPRPASQQIANALRAAILTRKLAPGQQLPSGPDLMERYRVAKATASAAIKILQDEGLVVTRKGSGTYVRERTERPVGLRPHVERAFRATSVSIDFAGFSGETLHGALQEPLDMIRAGRLTPESISVRILLPDTTAPMGLPSRAEDRSDDPELRMRARQIMLRHTEAIAASVEELADLGLVKNATASIRVYVGAPLFKLYILNNEDAFFGFYPVVRHSVAVGGQTIEMFDPMGKDATLFPFAADDDRDSASAQFVAQARTWFDSMWSTVARDLVS